VYGGVGLEKQSREAARANIIVATPGRLEDLLQRRAFTLANVGMLVLDEADRMLDMGFRPAVDRIVGACPKDRQTLFFSATLDGEAGKIANVYTRDAARHEHVATERKAAAIDHAFVAIERDDRLTALEGALRSPGRDLALVFVRTKRGADRLVKRLASSGVEAVAMHGDKSQRQRERALSSFESGKVNVLVATDVAARGIDVADISHVINFDPPEDRETYVHRTGRTGRAGRTGAAVTFVGIEQVRDVGKIAQELGLTAAFEQAGLSAGRHGGGGGRPAHATGNTAERRNHPRPARRQEQRPRHTSGSDGEAPRGSRQRAGRQRTRREGGTR
jgi:superfamily II DNA/RNA helicase